MAAADPARSRSRNFWILPVDVFGSSPNTTLFGTLNRARCCRQCSMISCSATAAPGFSSTNAHGVSPHRGSGLRHDGGRKDRRMAIQHVLDFDAS